MSKRERYTRKESLQVKGEGHFDWVHKRDTKELREATEKIYRLFGKSHSVALPVTKK